PVQRPRPAAAGDLPVPAARLLAILLVLVIFPAAYLLSPDFMRIAAAYLLLNLAYSRWIKHIPILDVISIAMGFVLRVAAGVVLIVVARFSPWLYVVTTLGSLYIGFGKRRAELALLADGANSHRRVLDGYSISLLAPSITTVSSTPLTAPPPYPLSPPPPPPNPP